ncbi:MAG: RHS repeat-associated core domain-containing protein [Elusimicrobiota bacterium]|nr:RHS repeat-associated core domain-containing protein [Elusimicrobiota bacterium]
MARNFIRRILCGGLCVAFLFTQQNSAFALEIYNTMFPAGGAKGSTGLVDFITVGEPIVGASTGILAGFGFAYAIPAKAAVIGFVNTPAVAVAGAEAAFSAEVLDSRGRPIKNIEVMFSRFSEAGLLEAAAARTGEDGKAIAVFKSTATAQNIIRAQVLGLPPVSKKMLWLVAPSGSLTGLPAADDGIQPHVLSLGNNLNANTSENSWGRHWSPNDVISFASARREMNFSNGMLFPHDLNLKKAWKKIKKGISNGLKELIKPLAVVAGIAAIYIGAGVLAGVLTFTLPPLIAVGLLFGGGALITYGSSGGGGGGSGGGGGDGGEGEPQYCVSQAATLSANTHFDVNFRYALTSFQSSSQNDIAGNTIAQPPYTLSEKGSPITTAIDKLKIASVNSGFSQSGTLTGGLANFQVSRPATITNLGPVGGNNLITIQNSPFSKSSYDLKPPDKANWAEQSLNDKISVKDLAAGNWGKSSLGTTLHGQTNSMLSGKNQWIDSGVALNTSGKAIQWSNATGKNSYQGLNDFNPQNAPSQPGPNVSVSGETSPAGESPQDNVFNVMSKSNRTFKGVSTFAGLTPNPVNTLTGNLLYSVEDFYLPGRGLFVQFVRFYNNLNAHKNGPFGYGWTHNYNMALKFRPNGDVEFEAGDGGVLEFIRNPDGTYMSANGVYSRLVRETDTYALVHKHGSRYVFDGNGALQKITDTNGNTINLAYADGKLTKITDPAGRVFAFSYDSGGRIAAIAGPGNQTVSYGYSASGDLENVGYPGGKYGAYEYDEPHLLASYDDSKSQTGMPTGIYEYDDLGRIAEELDAAGNILVSLAYSILPDGSCNTTLTDAKGISWIDGYDNRGLWTSRKNPLGDETQYKWNDNLGLVELTEPDGKKTQIIRDDKGNELKIIYPDGSEVTRQYEPVFSRMLAETSPLGQTYTYSHDNYGNLTSITDPENHTVRFSYDARGSLTEHTDQMGRKTLVANDGYGNMEQIVDPAGGKRTYTYDSLGNLASTTDENGHASSFSWSTGNELLQIDYPDNSKFKMAYDEHGNLLSEENGNGGKTVYSYSQTGRISNFTDAEGGVHSFEYDVNGLMTGITGPLGNTNTLSYDELGRLIKNTDSFGAVHEITYDKSARETSLKDARGNAWQLNYDLNGRVSKIIQPDATDISLQYDANDQIVEVKSALGDVTQFNYDKSGQLVEKINPGNKKETFQRDAIGNITSYINPAGGVQTFNYNVNNELVGAKDSEGREWSLARNGAGDVTALTDPLGNISRYTYTPAGEIAVYTDPENNAWKFTYDLDGNLTASEDPLGRKTEFKYDPLNQPIEQKDPEGNTLKYNYDINGNITQIQTSGGTILNLTRDLEGRVLAVADSEGGTRHFKYDLSGNLIEEKDANGNTWKFGANSLDRLVSITDPENRAYVFDWDAGGNLVKETDRAGNTWNYTWSPDGKIKSIADAAGKITAYTYNTLGHLTEIAGALGGITRIEYDSTGLIKSWTDPENRITIYTHDNAGRPASITDPAGNSTSYKHDKKGKVVESIDPLGASTRYRFDAAGNNITVINPLGKETSYSYDKNNRLIKTIYSDQTSVSYSYDANGNILTQTDQNGAVTRSVYDTLSRVTSKISPENQTVSYEYDHKGNLVAATAPGGNTTRYSYDSFSRLLENRDPAGNSVSYQYDANGNRTAGIDAAGSRTVYEYDALNRVVKQTGPDGAATGFVYDALGRQVSATDLAGNVSSSEYDASGRLIKSINPQGGATLYGYDSSGNLISVTDPQGNTTRTEYDKAGRVAAVVDAVGNRTEYTLDAAGNITAVKDPLGHSVSSNYDATGRLASTTDALNRTILYNYDVVGNRTAVTDALGHVTRYEYNADNRLSAVIDPLGNKTSYQYDARGNKVRETDALGRVTSYEYDAAGRLSKLIDPLGGDAVYEYDSRGLRTKETWPDNRSVFYSYDAVGRLISSRDGAGNITRYSYDGSGNLASKTDARGNSATFEYGAMSRLTKVTDAEGGVWRYVYDEAGRLTGITDANSHAMAFEYNKQGRITAIADALGGRTGFEYDATGNMTRLRKPTGEAQEYVYDAGNRLTSAKAGAETWNFTWNSDDLLAGFSGGGFAMSYDYDSGHRLTRTGYDSMGKALLYVYDAVGNRTKLVREDTSDVNYAYDALNRVIEINEHNRAHRFNYDPVGRITQRTSPNGVVGIYNFDSAGRLEKLEHRKSDGILLNKFAYTYDSNSNRTSVTDSVGKYDYAYDKLDRLVKAVFPSGRTQEFTYDHVGNRTRLAQLWPEHLAKANGITGTPVNGNVSETITYTYDEADRMLSAGDKAYAHDATGRLTRIQAPPNITTTFDYDGFDRPARIAGLKDALTGAALPTNEFFYAPMLPSLSFTPAPLGSRIKKTDSQGVAQFILDNTGNVLAELDANRAVKRQYLHALKLDEPLSMTDEHNHTYYYLPDGLGSVSMLTDILGDPVQNYNYEPYGKSNVTARDKNPFKFTSREYDPDSQLQYNRARYYAPELGRWITPDPLASLKSRKYYAERLARTDDLNLFNYVKDNPLAYTDPTGLYRFPNTCPKLSQKFYNAAAIIGGKIIDTGCQDFFNRYLSVNQPEFDRLLSANTLPDVRLLDLQTQTDVPGNYTGYLAAYPGVLVYQGQVTRIDKFRYQIWLDDDLEKSTYNAEYIAATILHELTHYADEIYQNTKYPGSLILDSRTYRDIGEACEEKCFGR